MIRLHVTSDLSPGAAVAPTLDQSRYLTQVMRLKAGDDLLVGGAGNDVMTGGAGERTLSSA